MQYGQKVEEKLKRIAAAIPWARGWPDNKTAFWNAEAFMWQRKIDQKTRTQIEDELAFLNNGKNLDIGCGAYSYLPSVAGLDLSEEMLTLNDRLQQKVVHDLEKRLPFPAGSFDSVTAIFVLNYITRYEKLLREIQRVLTGKGLLVAVVSSKPINDWQRQKEVNTFSAEEWRSALEQAGFKVNVQPQKALLFFHCCKRAAKTI